MSKKKPGKKLEKKRPSLSDKQAAKLNAILEGICDLNDELVEILEVGDVSHQFRNASDRLQEAEMWIQNGFEANGYTPEGDEEEDDEDDEDDEDSELEEDGDEPEPKEEADDPVGDGEA